jgi:hypothetical protein
LPRINDLKLTKFYSSILIAPKWWLSQSIAIKNCCNGKRWRSIISHKCDR